MTSGIRGIKTKQTQAFLANGTRIPVTEVSLSNSEPAVELKPGDVIDVTGVSKGKGFAGVVKRHHFRGGPRTHGQSDRERAPGSIGQTTTPGRVYRGKRMAGRMGGVRATVKNLRVVAVRTDSVLIKGLVPGPLRSRVTLKRVGEGEKNVSLYERVKEEKDAS